MGNYSSNHRRCSIKKLLLNISQYSQEKTCVGVSFNKVAGLKTNPVTASCIGKRRREEPVTKNSGNLNETISCKILSHSIIFDN